MRNPFKKASGSDGYNFYDFKLDEEQFEKIKEDEFNFFELMHVALIKSVQERLKTIGDKFSIPRGSFAILKDGFIVATPHYNLYQDFAKQAIMDYKSHKKDVLYWAYIGSLLKASSSSKEGLTSAVEFVEKGGSPDLHPNITAHIEIEMLGPKKASKLIFIPHYDSQLELLFPEFVEDASIVCNKNLFPEKLEMSSIVAQLVHLP